MKLNFKDFGRKCQFPILLAAGSMPLPMLVCAQIMPDKQNACLLMAAAYVAAAWLCTVLPGKVRVPAGILLSAGLAALGFALLPMLLSISVCLIPLMYIILLLGGLRIGGWPQDQEIHPMPTTVCLVGHMFAQFMVNVNRQNTSDMMYESVAPLLTVSFLIFAALGLMSMNRANLVSAVNAMGGLPRSMRLKNRLLTAGLMGIVLLVSALPAVVRAIAKVWEWIKTAALMILQLILSLLPEQGGGGSGGGGMDMSMFGGGEREQSWLSVILEKIVLALAVVIAVVLLVLALRVVWKKLRILMKKLIERLNAYMATSSEDYVDEISDTRDDADHDRSRQRRRRQLLRKRVDESALTPRERVRYRYLMMWLKHPEWTPECTARENLSGDAADLYERARYSSHEITEREAAVFAQLTEKRRG